MAKRRFINRVALSFRNRPILFLHLPHAGVFIEYPVRGGRVVTQSADNTQPELNMISPRREVPKWELKLQKHKSLETFLSAGRLV